jgi:dynein heavy chain
MERKLYGPLGYNMNYPFSLGDLRDSCVCLSNYMENSAGGKIPWADLRYIFGEIMYGGHIVNDFDRLLANTYLQWIMKDDLLESTEMFPFMEDANGPSFKCPEPTTYDHYLEHIEESMPPETPLAFGLHPNAEIDFRTTQTVVLFATLMELQPRDGGGAGEGASPEEIAGGVLSEINDKIGDKKFDTEDIARSMEEVGPYQNVFVQECDRFNVLTSVISTTLHELSLGFAGELTMSEKMEELQNCLFLDKIPAPWAKVAWPSGRGLATWVFDMMARLAQLEEWTQNPMEIPKVTWMSGLINPQSFLTAIMQVTAQKNQLELDKLVVQTEVKRVMTTEEIEGPSRDGAYIKGLSLQVRR